MSKTSYEIAVKAVTWFVVLDQVRKTATEAEDAHLVDSVRRHGVLQPLGARRDGRLVWGHRRLKAAAAAGLSEVPTVLLHQDMTEGEFLTVQMLENVQRADLSPFDLYQGCVRLLEANPGWGKADVAKALSLDPSMVTRILAPARAVPPVLEALRAGGIGLSAVYAITKAESPAEQERLLALCLAGTNRDALEREARKGRAARPAGVRLARVVCPLPTGAKVVVSGPEMDLGGLIDALAAALDAARRASKESLDIRTAEKVWKDKSRKV
ncbi:MAG TPA: ParB/RepB/Spo0J family partition protein [Urbifossiella sp.]|jgi:ParB/RepB/Spo0J family partition protein|nr:ParB/RepB/Spo0J family partition protein [Urbifossiella sp.]